MFSGEIRPFFTIGRSLIALIRQHRGISTIAQGMELTVKIHHVEG